MVSIPSIRKATTRPIILLFGDSITEQGFGYGEVAGGAIGWASLLSKDYCRRADVLNRGYSGYNTRHALQILPTTTNDNDLLFATVFFGANDAARSGELQHIPITEYGQNLRRIVHHFRNQQKETDEEDNNNNNQKKESSLLSTTSSFPPVILFTPPPVDGIAWSDRGNEIAKEYGNVVKEVGKELNCSVLDVFTLLEGNESVQTYGKYLRDGLHLSEDGNILLYQGLMKLLQKDYPHLLPKDDDDSGLLPLDGKLWREMCQEFSNK
mmetsp:Transcript_35865/g.39648  ORF Transcript_35865/g.39648 Transcript_35865/m.39648 type:complete len:267 (+) Transcript_35865:40-840(+)